MKLLQTYEDRDEAEEAAAKLVGKFRVASERDAGERYIIYWGSILEEFLWAQDVQASRVKKLTRIPLKLDRC